MRNWAAAAFILTCTAGAAVAPSLMFDTGRDPSQPIAKGEADWPPSVEASPSVSATTSPGPSPVPSGETHIEPAPPQRSEPAPPQHSETGESTPDITRAFEYENCAAVVEVDAAPILEGEFGFGTHLDRDDDGIGCEEEDPPPVNVEYEDCVAVIEAGAAPIREGDPGFETHLDPDGDGVGCENGTVDDPPSDSDSDDNDTSAT